MYREHNEQVEQMLAEAHKRLNSGMRQLHNFPARQGQKRKQSSSKSGNDSVEGILTMVVFIVLVSLLLGGMIWETHNASVNGRAGLPRASYPKPKTQLAPKATETPRRSSGAAEECHVKESANGFVPPAPTR